MFLRILSLFLLAGSSAFALHLRVASWNIQNNPDDAVEDSQVLTVMEMMGPVSVLFLMETDTGSSTRALSLLRSAYPLQDYQMVTTSSVWGDRIALIYADSVLDLQSWGEVDSLAFTRPMLSGDFRPDAVSTDSHDFRVYGAHLKSGPDKEDELSRAGEVNAFLQHLQDAQYMGPLLLVGDLNLSGPYEDAWQSLLTHGLVDLGGAPDANWRGNSNYRHLHTQGSDGLHLRLDFILSSSTFHDGRGLEYLEETYSVVGNNGTHPLYGSITEGTGATVAQLNALESASDHLPIVADLYHLPHVTTPPSDFENHVRVQWTAVSGSQYDILQSSSLNEPVDFWDVAARVTSTADFSFFDYEPSESVTFWSFRPVLNPALPAL